MYFSKLFVPTVKEDPSDAELISHKLMVRSGMIKRNAAGIYSWLPVGLKVLKKVEEIVRKNLNNFDAEEILMPMVQPAELWKESGRYGEYGKELLKFDDRSNRGFVLGPTHEEIICEIFRSHPKSYKDLPVNLYQIQTKFRDEIRPRFGVMRSREFLMKDAYSFDIDEKGLVKSYGKMKDAYISIFNEIGLDYRIVKADSGNIGGDISEEFHILADSGEDLIAVSNSSDFAANVEVLNYDKDPSELEGKKSPDGKGKLKIKRGIEVGHIFQLGQKYSQAMNVGVKDMNGNSVHPFMGCYGIGVSRIVAAAIEQNHDDRGIQWPDKITPFGVNIICLDPESDEIMKVCSEIYSILKKSGFDPLLDDRDIRAGIKFKEHELLGIPYSIIIGPNNFKNTKLEFGIRAQNEKIDMKLDDIKKYLGEKYD
ncbi:proline--tRNA ligase [SAR86 cluster bacterium]|uniref:Proline--tRNA ligase n=1 Tax=SAR86 cluster bacterium TaxID=2030880 RepID=A0A9Q8X2A4_9GAMM|nr:proline--tRNA ligase [SAR86 cluster bacterium]